MNEHDHEMLEWWVWALFCMMNDDGDNVWMEMEYGFGCIWMIVRMLCEWTWLWNCIKIMVMILYGNMNFDLVYVGDNVMF